TQFLAGLADRRLRIVVAPLDESAGYLPAPRHRFPGPSTEEDLAPAADDHLGARGVADEPPPRPVDRADGGIRGRGIAALGGSTAFIAEPHGHESTDSVSARRRREPSGMRWPEPVLDSQRSRRAGEV